MTAALEESTFRPDKRQVKRGKPGRQRVGAIMPLGITNIRGQSQFVRSQPVPAATHFSINQPITYQSGTPPSVPRQVGRRHTPSNVSSSFLSAKTEGARP